MHQATKVHKFIVFKVADYLLALPMNNVLKVVNCPPATSGGLRTMGIVQIGHHTIRVLDLHQQLSSSGLLPFPGNQPFLVILRTPQGELCGLLVDEPPNLVELPLEMLQSLPHSSSQSTPLQMVSHAAVVTQEDVTTTIFLLDVKRLLKTALDNSYLLSE